MRNEGRAAAVRCAIERCCRSLPSALPCAMTETTSTNPPVRSFRGLIVWQRAMELAEESVRLADRLPVRRLRGLRDQIERILITQMSRANQERWLERLRRNGYVKYY